MYLRQNVTRKHFSWMNSWEQAPSSSFVGCSVIACRRWTSAIHCKSTAITWCVWRVGYQERDSMDL